MKKQYSEKTVNSLMDIFKTLSNEISFKILCTLIVDGEKNVNDIAFETGANPHIVSKYLNKMYRLGYVDRKKFGTSTLYWVACKEIKDVIDIVTWEKE